MHNTNGTRVDNDPATTEGRETPEPTTGDLMKINADLTKRAVEHSEELPWSWSPDRSVQRRMLDRDGGEVARATSIVRYPAGSRFPPHVHGGGEEFLVLEGIFSDENGAYATGSYVRNPPGSRHAPFSEEGCTIFVKLRQFDPSDGKTSVIDTSAGAWQPSRLAGVEEQELHRFGEERVTMLRVQEDTDLGDCAWPGGAELLVLRGALEDAQGRYTKGSWLRLPAGTSARMTATGRTLAYLKTGHLPSAGGGQAPADMRRSLPR